MSTLMSRRLHRASPRAQGDGEESARRKALDTILDPYVRDGFVYYRALKADHGHLDAYLAQVASAPIDKASREAQLAFWLNAYDGSS